MKKLISLISVLWLAALCNPVCAAENIDITDLIKGEVILEFVVTKEGKVRDPEVIKSVPAGVFDEAALEAAKKLRFKPPTEKGVPVDAIISKVMRFKMSATEFEANKVSNDGIKHLENGEYENALSEFSAAIGINPENGQYYDLRGQAYNELGNYQKAIEDFSRAIEKGPGMLDAYFDRGEALRKLGKSREAIEDFTKVIESDEKYIQAYNSRAFSYKKLGEIGNMCLDLKKVCELGDCRGIEIAQKAEKCE